MQCPDPQDGVRLFFITTDPASACLAYGDGPNDVNGAAGDVIVGMGYEALDKDESGEVTPGAYESWLNFPGVSWGDDKSGTFVIAPGAWATYGDLVLSFKVGNRGPTWAAYQLGSGVLGGTWEPAGSGRRAVSRCLIRRRGPGPRTGNHVAARHRPARRRFCGPEAPKVGLVPETNPRRLDCKVPPPFRLRPHSRPVPSVNPIC